MNTCEGGTKISGPHHAYEDIVLCSCYSSAGRGRDASRRRPGMAWLLTSGSVRLPSLMLPSSWLYAASSPPPPTSAAVGTLIPLPEGLLVVLVQLLSSADVQPLLGTDEPSGTGGRGGSCKRSVPSSGRGVLCPQCSPSAPVDTICLRVGCAEAAVLLNANPEAEDARTLAEWAWLLGVLPIVPVL